MPKKDVDNFFWFCPAQAKREAFRLARGRHYSNEAEAMKRAQALIKDDDDDVECVEGSPGPMEVDDDAEEAHRTGRSKVPSVPPLPNNINGVAK